MCHKNVRKYKIHCCKICSFQAINTPKLFSAGAPVLARAGGAYNAPPVPLVGWGGKHPFPSTPLPLDLGTYGASVVRSPTQIPCYAYDNDNES